MNRFLIPSAARVLRLMRMVKDGELVQAVPGGWWVGDIQVPARGCWHLLRLALLREEHERVGRQSFFRYTAHAEAWKVLDDENYVPEIIGLIAKEEKLRKGIADG